VTFKPGEIKEVPGYIHNKGFISCPAPTKAAQPKPSAKLSAESQKPTTSQPKSTKIDTKSESKVDKVETKETKLDKKEETVDG
jgi:uncharacterized protein involved in copper resistance